MNKKGFTLVELVIVIVIVGILSIISVPVYRGYVEKAIMTEGKTLIGALGKAQLAYHVENEEFKTFSTKTDADEDLDIDARGGKYFRAFTCKSKGTGEHPSGETTTNTTTASQINKADADDYEAFAKEWVSLEVYGQHNSTAWTLYSTQWGDGYMLDIKMERGAVISK